MRPRLACIPRSSRACTGVSAPARAPMSRPRSSQKGSGPASVAIQAALCDATFFPLHDRKNPPNATFNVYRASDDNWFLIVVTPDKWPALATGIGRPRSSDGCAILGCGEASSRISAQLTAILDEVFGSQPMAHWREVFDHAHVPFGVVQGPSEVINDPQLRANDIVVPLEGAGGNLTVDDQQSYSGARCDQSTCKARPGNWRTQRRGSQATRVRRRTKSTACARAAPSRKQKNARQRPNKAAPEPQCRRPAQTSQHTSIGHA